MKLFNILNNLALLAILNGEFNSKANSSNTDIVVFSHSNTASLDNMLNFIANGQIKGLENLYIFHDFRKVDGTDGFYSLKEKYFGLATFINLGFPPQATISPVLEKIIYEFPQKYIALTQDAFNPYSKIDLNKWIDCLSDGSIIIFADSNNNYMFFMQKDTATRIIGFFKLMEFSEKIYFPKLDLSKMNTKKIAC